MSLAPFMPLFCDAYLGDTMHLSLEEHGAYLKLLMITWRNNGQALPDNDARLARMLGVTLDRWRRKLRPVLIGFFDLSDGSWRQPRLEKQWKQSQNFIAEQRDKAKRRWADKPLKNKDVDDAAALVRDMPDGCPPTPEEAGSRIETSPEKTKPAKTAQAPLYAFVGKVIRLKSKDFEAWRTAYHDIPDLTADLVTLDAYYDAELTGDNRRKWFIRCAAALDKRHQQYVAERKRIEAAARRPITERYPNEGVFH